MPRAVSDLAEQTGVSRKTVAIANKRLVGAKLLHLDQVATGTLAHVWNLQPDSTQTYPTPIHGGGTGVE